MTDFEEMRTFRDYVADPDDDALARAYAAVAGASRPRARRRRAVVRRTALVAALGAVATLAIALQPGNDRGGAGAGPAGADPPRLGLPSLEPANAAEIRRRIVAAIDAADGILHQRIRTEFLASGDLIKGEGWNDLRRPDAFRSREYRRAWDEPRSGFSVTDSGQVPRGADALLLRRVIDGQCSELLLRAKDGFGPTENALDTLRSNVRTLGFKVVGDEEIEGRAVLHLRHFEHDPDSPDVVARTDLWVDRTTLEPVRAIEVTGDRDAGPGDPAEAQRTTRDFELLDRPAVPDAVLLPPIPGGATCPRTERVLR